MQEMVWGEMWKNLFQVFFCRTLLSKHNSTWLKTIQKAMFSFWLHISFIFLFHLHECLKKKEKNDKTPLLVPFFLPQTLTT